MSSLPFDRAVLEFLGKLEALEARLLTWGVIDGLFSDAELRTHADAFVERYPDLLEDGERLLEELFERKLLFEVRRGSAVGYRSRMAETVRLLAQLRQLWPGHENGRAWSSAKTLVGDFRFVTTPRRYPRRDVTPDTALKHIEQEVGKLGESGRAVFRALTVASSGPLGLSDFQVESVARILGSLRRRISTGTIVSAGTGSGKTLAFYLPALIHLADEVRPKARTRVLCIYPRNELLKDQLADAYASVVKVNKILRAARIAPISVGALFGDVPRDPSTVTHEQWGWKRVGSGWECPFLRCSSCNKQMVWRQADHQAKRLVLSCPGGNHPSTHPDEFRVTREAVAAEPPDLLFTSTEMLNQRLTDSDFAHIFGVGNRASGGPDLVLMDEVHTYQGQHGAHVAMLLRRWRYASSMRGSSSPVYVGLSATLANAANFFAHLTGLAEGNVSEVRPRDVNMESEGAEYLLALRGDPSSRASLLSTTIQTVMLLRRCLDTSIAVSKGAYGRRLFAFTDDLDVTNRLYFNVLDAEGRDSFGNPDFREKPMGSLAGLRSPQIVDDARARSAAGQIWSMSADIGHALDANDRLRIDRVSSQDSGVAPDADVVVATASLEVGFNDVTVGAVVQHKSPHGMAQFLQRKGRAGRDRRMRPWTVAVLSDFGRDRITYQSYERLFDPELSPRHLPLRNISVLKMQATYALLDWLGLHLGTRGPGTVWKEMAGPRRDRPAFTNPRRRESALQFLEELMNPGDRVDEFRQYLMRALTIGQGLADVVLWEAPRSLLLHVVPTLHRRILTEWSRFGKSGADLRSRAPLPDFIPGQLFAELSLPDVTIVTPPQRRGAESDENAMAIRRGLSEFAPGRISRRFGVLHRFVRHWIPVPALGRDGGRLLNLSDYLPSESFDEIGMLSAREEEAPAIRVVRPFRVEPQVPPKGLADSTNAFLQWHTGVCEPDAGFSAPLPTSRRWGRLIVGLSFHTHLHHCSVEVQRFSDRSEGTLVFDDGRSEEFEVRFVDAGIKSPFAVGFTMDVDAARLRVRFPETFAFESGSAKDLGCRVLWFREEVRRRLDGLVSKFRRDTLAQVFVSVVSARALLEAVPFAEAVSRSISPRGALRVDDALDVVFQTLSADDGATHTDDKTGDAGRSAERSVVEEILSYLREPRIVGELRGASAAFLSGPILADGWSEWLKDRFLQTLGAAFHAAICQLCPEVDGGDLLVDTFRPSVLRAHDEGEIWFSEPGPGGGGLIEHFHERYVNDPRRFWALVESALEASDAELVDAELRRILQWITTDEATAAKVARVRDAHDHTALLAAHQDLLAHLSQQGALVAHPVVSALNTRVLRPGSGPGTDKLMVDLLAGWVQAERVLGVEIDARVYAFVRSADEALHEVLPDPGTTGAVRRAWRFAAIYGLLWPRGAEARGEAMRLYNPYVHAPLPDRLLVLEQLGPDPSIVEVAEAQPLERALELLAREGICTLRGHVEQAWRLKQALIALALTPVDLGPVLGFARVVRSRRRENYIDVLVEIAEGPQ